MKTVTEVTIMKLILTYLQCLLAVAENTFLLDLSHPLEPFQSCNVGIVYLRLHRSIYTGSSNEVTPLTFPHSISLYEYTRRRGGPLVCNGHQGFQLVRPSTGIQTPEQYRLSCRLRVLINPKPCTEWQLQRSGILFQFEDQDTYKILPRHFFHGYMDYKKQPFEYFIHVQVLDTKETKHILSVTDFLVLKKFVSKDNCPGCWPVFSSVDMVLRFFYYRNAKLDTTSIRHSEMFLVSYGQLLSIICKHLMRFNWLQDSIRNRKSVERLTSKTDILLIPCYSSDIIGRPTAHKFFSQLDKSPVWIWNMGLDVAPILIQQTQLRGDQNDPFVYNLAKVLFHNSSILIADRIKYPVIVGAIPMFQLHNGTYAQEIYFELPIQQYFVSCTSISNVPTITLAGYVSSFDVSTWIGIGSSVFVSCWLLFISQGVLSFQQVIFAYMLLVGQGVARIPLSRLFFASWLVAWVFVTEHYRGSNIDKFTLPLIPSPLDSFEELIPHKFNYYAPPYVGIRSVFAHGMSEWGLNDTQFYYEHMVKTKKTHMFDIGLDVFLRNLREANLKKHETSYLVLEEVLSRLYVPESVQEFLNFTGFEYYKRYTTCSREAFVSDYKNAAMFFHTRTTDGKTPKNKLHFNSKPLQNAYSSVNAKNLMPYSMGFTRRVYILLQSGIDKIWAEWSRDNMVDISVQKTLQDFHSSQRGISTVKAISLADNILTVFIAWGFGILLSVLSAGIENAPSKATLRTVYVRLREIISLRSLIACWKKARQHIQKIRNTHVELLIASIYN